MNRQQLTQARAANPKDTYARDRIRFLERLLFDLIEILERDAEGWADEDLAELKARLCAERGGV